MSTISAPRPSHKRPHIASPTPNTHVDDHSSKRQKTPDSRGPALPADFFDTSSAASSTSTPTILPIGGRDRTTPATNSHAPSPPSQSNTTTAAPTTAAIDEDEWAAFEADIAETEASLSAAPPVISSAVITAAPTGPGGAISMEEAEETRIDEAALDREDAQNKLVEEFEEMESLESRVQKLKEQREALRAKATESVGERMDLTTNGIAGKSVEEGDDEDEDEDEDDWIHFSR